jgi:minor extracellular protease Epr
MRKIHLGILVLIVLALCFSPVQAIPEQATQRVIVHTTAPFEKGIFQQQGCTIVHELNEATAIECPEGVLIPNAELDEVLHILDTTSDAQIHADDVWDLNPSITGKGVVVAVLDTGVNYTHPELHPYTTGASLVLNGGIGGGKSFVSYTTSFNDDNGHGTHVSGIITADGDMDESAKGVAPDATVWMAKVCNSGGSCYTSDMVAAIEYVVNNDIAKIMSISIGGGGTVASACDYDYLATKINWAYNNGVVSAIAAGNDGRSKVSSPACASKAIAVAAVDSSDTRAHFSNYGNALKDHGVAAPGVSIYSTIPGNDYASWTGTSMATPHVGALAALMLQANSSLTPADVRFGIFNSADCLNNKYGTCPNIYIGFGRVDALAAVNSIDSGTTPPPLQPYLTISAEPSTITEGGSSIVTAITSDVPSSILVDFTTTLGNLNPTSCTLITGRCSVTFTSTMTGTAIITASAGGYTPGSTQVTVTAPSTCVKVPRTCNCDGICHKKESTTCGDCLDK